MATTKSSVKVTGLKQHIYNWLIDQAAERKKRRATDGREGTGSVVKEILEREYERQHRRTQAPQT